MGPNGICIEDTSHGALPIPVETLTQSVESHFTSPRVESLRELDHGKAELNRQHNSRMAEYTREIRQSCASILELLQEEIDGYTMNVFEKSEVYGYGVVLLIVLTCKHIDGKWKQEPHLHMVTYENREFGNLVFDKVYIHQQPPKTFMSLVVVSLRII